MTETRTKKVGVVLAGCGFLDGAEIQEATLTLLALDQRGVDIVAMAPNIPQMHVVDHAAQSPVDSATRNVLQESARIARCEIQDVADVDPAVLDAVIYPGGFGAAKNLCSFAVDGPNGEINADVQKLIRTMRENEKPQGFMCIAPALAAFALGKDYGVTLTIGTDADTAANIEALGAKHQNCAVDEIVYDEVNKVVSTPAYMLGPSIAHIHRGIDKLVAKVLELA